MNVLDLFSGIGGFSLGLERTGGFNTVAFCECDPYCQRVLRKHWPDVPCFPDVATLRGTDVPRVDLICGGFPCQDISLAGKGAGLAGERSGLWREFARIIGEVRPRYVIVENVPALLGRGMGRVLGDLAALGYDAQWHCIPAAVLGAPHRRDRLWIVAYPNGAGREDMRHGRGVLDAGTGAVGSPQRVPQLSGDSGAGQELAVADADGEPTGRLAIPRAQCDGWRSEPDVGRVAHGVPARVDRLRALGNAIVPQIAELLGHAILAHAQQ